MKSGWGGEKMDGDCGWGGEKMDGDLERDVYMHAILFG